MKVDWPKGERCEGGYIGVHDERESLDRAPCPTCGRVVSFHRITGKFRAHNDLRSPTERES